MAIRSEFPPHVEVDAELQDTLGEALRALSSRFAVDMMELTRKVQAMRDGFDGTVLAGGNNSAVSPEKRRQPGTLVYDAVRANLQIANELMTLGQSQADYWLDRFQRLGQTALPSEKRPRIRRTCTAAPGGEPTWSFYVFNAAREARVVWVTGRWLPRDDGSKVAFAFARSPNTRQRVVIPPRTERLIEFTHAPINEPGEFTARGSVRMRPSGDSAAPSLVVGRLELAVTVGF